MNRKGEVHVAAPALGRLRVLCWDRGCAGHGTTQPPREYRPFSQTGWTCLSRAPGSHRERATALSAARLEAAVVIPKLLRH